MKKVQRVSLVEVQLSVDHPHLFGADLESLIGMAADQIWNVGDVYQPGGCAKPRTYCFSRWAIGTVVETLDELDGAVQDLMGRIKPVEQRLCGLPADASVKLTLFITETNTVLGFGFDAGVLESLAKINSSLEISLVLTSCN